MEPSRQQPRVIRITDHGVVFLWRPVRSRSWIWYGWLPLPFREKQSLLWKKNQIPPTEWSEAPHTLVEYSILNYTGRYEVKGLCDVEGAVAADNRGRYISFFIVF